MIHNERTLEIDASTEALWAELGRFMSVHEIAPEIVRVDALTDGETGIGSRRRCHFKNGSSMVEEVVAWSPGSGFSIRASDIIALPLREVTADISITPITARRSKVTWSVDFRARYGPLGWILGHTLLKQGLGKVLEKNLAALADKVSEVGEDAVLA